MCVLKFRKAKCWTIHYFSWIPTLVLIDARFLLGDSLPATTGLILFRLWLGGGFQACASMGNSGELRLIHIIPEAFFGGEFRLVFFDFSTFMGNPSASGWSESFEVYRNFRASDASIGVPFFGDWMDWRDISGDTGDTIFYQQIKGSAVHSWKLSLLNPADADGTFWLLGDVHCARSLWFVGVLDAPRTIQKTEPSEHIRTIL